MATINRRDIARKISQDTGFYLQDIEYILEKEEEAIEQFIQDEHEKIKIGKLLQIEVFTRPTKKAWDGIRKEYYELEPRLGIKAKLLKKARNIIEDKNKDI